MSTSPPIKKGHTLDLVCTTGITISNLTSIDLTVSDHLAITLDINTPTPHVKQKRTITFRNIKSIKLPSLSSALAATVSASVPIPTISPIALVNYHNDALSSCFDIIAPIKSKLTSLTRSAPWYTDQLRHLKRHGRQLERLAKRTGLTVHLDTFKLHQQQYIDALNTARSSIIQSGSNNRRTLFSIINKLLKPIDTISTSFTISTFDCVVV